MKESSTSGASTTKNPSYMKYDPKNFDVKYDPLDMVSVRSEAVWRGPSGTFHGVHGDPDQLLLCSCSLLAYSFPPTPPPLQNRATEFKILSCKRPHMRYAAGPRRGLGPTRRQRAISN